MDFAQFFREFAGKALSTPYNIAGWAAFLLAIILGIIDWRTRKKSPKKERKMKLLLWLVPATAFVIFIPISVALTSFSIYQEQQREIDRLQDELRNTYEEHMPLLSVDANIKAGSIIAYAEEQVVQFTINYSLKNQGDKPAYQTKVRGFVSPLSEPHKMMFYSNTFQMNPIYTEITGHIDSSVNYSMLGTKGIIIIYMNVQYSDLPENGRWNGDEYWFAFTLDLNNQKAKMEFVESAWKDSYRPYVEKTFSNDN